MENSRVLGGALPLAIALSVLLSVCASASWLDDGNPVCTEAGAQQYPDIIPDGAGGAIMVWEDSRGSDSDIYAQRFDPSGAALWLPDGVPVCTTSGGQLYPEIASDSANGAIIVWEDRRIPGGDIYAQRVDASGVVQWATNGIPICTREASQTLPEIESDGLGGADIVWQDFSGGGDTGWDMYVQRVDASGTILWTVDGVVASQAWGTQWFPEIVSDGSGGAILTWADRRHWNSDVFVQRVDASGIVRWTLDGDSVCTLPENQRYPEIISDGKGGAMISWTDQREGEGTADIYIQRVDSTGTMLWTEEGVLICGAADDQLEPAIVSDGAGGAIVTWYDKRNGIDYDIYAQRVDTLGVPLWTMDGVPVCTLASTQEWPAIAADGAGGAIITWHDLRTNSTYDVYGQRLNPSGTALWTADGVAMSLAAGQQKFPCVCTDNDEGAIIAWFDNRSGNDDIYAQRVSAEGCSGPTALTFAAVYTTATNGQVYLSWQMAVQVSAGDFVIKRSDSRDGVFVTLDLPVVEASGHSFSCIDRSVIPGRSYWYKIGLLGLSGEEYYGPVKVSVEPIPLAYKVHQSYPNPFNPVCTIRYETPAEGNVRLRVFDVSGSVVRTLVNRRMSPGTYSEVWDGKDQLGREMPSGVYFYRLEAADFNATRKMILLR